jgi:hypothetical protein
MEAINNLVEEESRTLAKARFVLKNVHLLPANSPLLCNARNFHQQHGVGNGEPITTVTTTSPNETEKKIPTSSSSLTFLHSVVNKLKTKDDEISSLKLKLATSEIRAGEYTRRMPFVSVFLVAVVFYLYAYLLGQVQSISIWHSPLAKKQSTFYHQT